jgi:hypothetical protein
MIALIEAKRVASSQATKAAWRQSKDAKKGSPNGKQPMQDKPAVTESAAVDVDAPKPLSLAGLKAAARARREATEAQVQ